MALIAFMTMIATDGRAALLPADWQNVQTVRIDRTGFVKMSLPIETIDAARPDLRDLRLHDRNGNEIPFRIDRPVASDKFVGDAVNFRVTLEEKSTIALFETGNSRPINRVTLVTPALDFIKGASLEGSSDGQTWEPILQSVPIFQQRNGAGRLHLDFPSCSLPHLRIKLDDTRTPPIPLTGARIHASEPDPVTSEPLDLKVIDREEDEEKTRITLRAAGANVTLAYIEIKAEEPLFARQVSLAYREVVEGEIKEKELARGTIYRVALEGQDAVSSEHFAEGITIPKGELVLTIHNGDSPPLAVGGIRGLRRPVYISWLAKEEGSVNLISGNAHCAPPRYDLGRVPADVSATLLSPIEVAPIEPNPSWQAAEPLPEIQGIGAAIDLSDWSFRRRLKLAKPGVQQAELDPETLSRSKPSLQDIRVIQNGKQLPYLLERTPKTRSLAPAVEKADDKKRPEVSRWVIRLPNPSIPLTRLTCDADNPFFKRTVRILEEVPDKRGSFHTVSRGSATWLRNLEDKKQRLELALSSPVTDKLILEVENGNNLPLELHNVQVFYPVVRVVFKSSTDGDTFLYYGNPKAQQPRYDIDLVASKLLAAEKSAASLSEMEQMKGSSWSKSGMVGAKAGWVFWISLCAVVVVLVLVIARLLPRKP